MNPNAKPVITAAVALRYTGETALSSIGTPLPPIFYVIVGAGPAAVINHSTLVHSDFGKDRLAKSPAGKLPIIHVGFSNPWGRYMRHGMGQLPYLLSLPGFCGANQVKGTDATVDGGLDSRVFAKGIDDQFTYLRERELGRWLGEYTEDLVRLQWPWRQAWVAMLQTRAKEAFTGTLADEIGGPAVRTKIDAIVNDDYPLFPNSKMAPFRLMVVQKVEGEWKAEWIYAQYIDFCTGTGRPRVIIKPEKTDEHKKALTPPWLDPSTWIAELGNRRILSGMDAICDDATWNEDERICVPKGGGIALNAAEKAVHNKCQLDWFDDKPLLGTFANPRNYTFLKHWSENRPRGVGENEPGHPRLADADLVPAYKKGRLGKNVEVRTAQLVQGGAKVEVSLAKKGDEDPLIRAENRVSAGLGDGCWDATGNIGNPPSKNYDRLALAQGLDAMGVGQPNWIADSFGLTNEIEEDESDYRMLGLGTADRTIRVLGAAAHVYPGFALGEYRPNENSISAMAVMWAYRATLPVSTVPDGFILSGINIALANKFFTGGKKNPNLNTMPVADIEKKLKDAGVAEDYELAEFIAAARNPANGFSDGDHLIAKLREYAQTLSNRAKRTTEDAYAKQQVDAAVKVITDDRDAELKRLNTAAKDMDKDPVPPLAGTLKAQIAELVELTKRNAELKIVSQSGLVDSRARAEYRELTPRAARVIELTEKHAGKLRTMFQYSYDPVED